jgi:hypothetical protein
MNSLSNLELLLLATLTWCISTSRAPALNEKKYCSSA